MTTETGVWFILKNMQTTLNDVSGKVNTLDTNVALVKQDVECLKKHLGAKTNKELKIERLKTIGKVVGLITLLVPGILSFFLHACGS